MHGEGLEGEKRNENVTHGPFKTRLGGVLAGQGFFVLVFFAQASLADRYPGWIFEGSSLPLSELVGWRLLFSSSDRACTF